MTCEVWWAPVSAAPALAHVPDEAERARAAAFRGPRDRARSTVAAAVLRLVAADRTGTSAGRVAVDRTCDGCGRPHGRPRLPGTPWHVSVSHSGDWVAVAATLLGAVGVDVEEERALDVSRLATTVLAPEERAGDARELLVCWTRKEAVVKATGDGLRVPLPEVRVGPAGAPAALASYPGRPGMAAFVRDLAPRPRHVAAVAVLTGEPVTVVERDASALWA